MRSIAVVGVSHRTASVEVRERVALDVPDRAEVTRRVLGVDGVREAVVLSTCNRTEVYAAGEPGSEDALPAARLVDAFRDLKDPGRELPDGTFVTFDGREAVAHALSVAAGLDSMVLGETQILAQVRDAYDEAVELRSVGPTFRRLFPASFRVAKRAHTETRISAGAASIGSIAVDLAAKVFDDLERRTVLLIGAGETGGTVARALKQRRVARVWITGHGIERATHLAERIGAHALPREDAYRRLHEADIVLAAAAPSGGDYVLAADDVARAMRGREGPHLLLIDVGVPRNVDPAAADLGDVFLYDLDDLEALADATRRRREGEVPRVLRFVERELAAFADWWGAARELDPLLRQLHGRFDSIRGRELARAIGRIPKEHHESVELFSRVLIDKLLQTPTRRLKGGGERLGGFAKTLRELFELDEDESK